MKRNFMFLLLVMLVLVFSNSSWAAYPCDPGDSVGTDCCGEDSDLSGYSRDAGICDTIYIEPWPHTDTCFAGDCVNYKINNPGEHFPCFLYVHLFVTHDSNTFWWQDNPMWTRDSLDAITVPLTFWHQPVSGMDADSVILPYEAMSWNNTDINPYFPWINRSMFRHFLNTRTVPPETTYNRLLSMVQFGFKSAWNVYTAGSPDYHASPGDSGNVSLNVVTMSPTCQEWWQGSRVLLATLTFKVYMSGDNDTTEICFDSVFWPPASDLAFTRRDAVNYLPRHLLPKCFKVAGDTVWSDVRWIGDFTEDEENKPTSFSVSQNYPNPFNPVTNFRFSLPQASHVKIEIFNILGQKVKTLVDKDMRAGVYLVDWDGMDERGVQASSGVYFYRIVAGDFSDIRKMILLK